MAFNKLKEIDPFHYEERVVATKADIEAANEVKGVSKTNDNCKGHIRITSCF